MVIDLDDSQLEKITLNYLVNLANSVLDDINDDINNVYLPALILDLENINLVIDMIDSSKRVEFKLADFYIKQNERYGYHDYVHS